MPPRNTSPSARPPTSTKASRRPKTRTAPVTHAPAAPEPTEEQIRQRAYEIYVSRGRLPGDPDADWRQAQQELRGRLQLLGRI